MEKIKISSMNLTKDLFTITDINGKTFSGKIFKGSVNFRIYNEDDQEVNLSNIEEGDVIKVYTISKKNSDLKEQKNNIIKKIIIKNKYVFNSESSDDFISDDENYFK
jgi:hypothetical protein